MYRSQQPSASSVQPTSGSLATTTVIAETENDVILTNPAGELRRNSPPGSAFLGNRQHEVQPLHHKARRRVPRRLGGPGVDSEASGAIHRSEEQTIQGVRRPRRSKKLNKK